MAPAVAPDRPSNGHRASIRTLGRWGETIESFGMGHPSLIVMVGEGRPTKTCCAGQHEGVDGRLSPTTTVST